MNLTTGTLHELERTVQGGAAAVEELPWGVARLPIVFVNAYLVGERGGPWALVDTGLPLCAPRVRAAAEARYGPGARPEAIILTHGHFDHAGSAMELARSWDVPLYAHPLEMPYLTGLSDYAPPDPTIGGAISFLSRFFPHSGYDFGARVRPLPADGSVPGMSGWRWIHTPGHTAGHTSLFHEEGRVLLAGDAVTTMDLDSWAAQITRTPELDRPPAPLTPDWQAARRSVEVLAELAPRVIAAGHGVALAGPRVAERLRDLERWFPTPPAGRYVPEPARADESGVVWVPSPVADPLPGRLMTGVMIGVAVAALASKQRKRR